MLNQIDIQDIITIAKEAGNAIMQVYKQDFEVEYKQDSSPLTLADKKANDIIEDGLNQLSVNLPILSEEGNDIPYEAPSNPELVIDTESESLEGSTAKVIGFLKSKGIIN